MNFMSILICDRYALVILLSTCIAKISIFLNGTI